MVVLTNNKKFYFIIMKHEKITILSLSLVLVGILFVGAGCYDNSIAIPANQVNNDSQIGQVSGNLADTAANAKINIDESNNSNMTDITEENMSENENISSEVPTSFPGVLPEEELANKQVRMQTSKGEIVFEILGKEGPKAASNFIALTKSGFYDGLIFHRVEPGFVIQGGDPQGTGHGGPGYKFEDDIVNLPYKAGIVAMANSGPDTNGSQFFIMLEDAPTLGPNYSIFGRVTSGMNIVKDIAIGDVMNTVVVEDIK